MMDSLYVFLKMRKATSLKLVTINIILVQSLQRHPYMDGVLLEW